jgi:RNA polymerase sigma-70 factor (ECF subfamily)
VNSFAESAFRRHYRTIHGFISRRVWDRDRADDLAQQVFVDAVSTLGSAQPSEETALAWLYTVARRRLADEVRRRGRDLALTDQLAGNAASGVSAEYGSRLGVVLSDVIAGLPRESGEIVVAHLLRGQSFPELARRTRVSEAALKMRYVRALRQLRVDLEQKGLER